MATIDGQAIASAVAPSGGGGPVGGEDMSQMPDVLVRAMAAALDAAAEEMEVHAARSRAVEMIVTSSM